MGYQYRFDIAGTEYGMPDVSAVKLEHPLFDKLSVGNTCSAELDITFWVKSDIPKMAKIVPTIIEKADVVALELATLPPVGTYSVDVPGCGRYDVEIPDSYGACKVTVSVGKSGVATAVVQLWNWFGTVYGDPQPLNIYANGSSTAPALTDYAGNTENTVGEVAVPLGVFWTDTRAAVGDMLNIIAYDAMMKADIVWVPRDDLEFPEKRLPMPDAVAEICRLMDVELDSRTLLNSAYTIDYPANDYTLRDVLGFIAAAHGGNWIFTNEGKLLLVPLFDSMPAETNYLVTEDGDAITFGGVRITV